MTLALGIIGATVMPHNLYLHSSISQTRKVDYKDPADIKRAVRFMTWDSNIELSLAFVVNSLLLILGAALFFGHGDKSVLSLACTMPSRTTILLVLSLVPFLSTLFAIALLASGQNSTITGTLTGQIVMEGFLRFRLTTMGGSSHDSDHCPSSLSSSLQFYSVTKNMSSMTFWFILKSSYQWLFLSPSSLWFISPPTRKSWESMSMRNGIPS